MPRFVALIPNSTIGHSTVQLPYPRRGPREGYPVYDNYLIQTRGPGGAPPHERAGGPFPQLPQMGHPNSLADLEWYPRAGPAWRLTESLETSFASMR